MNELIANALLGRLQPLIDNELIPVASGLVESFETDIFKDKTARSFPYALDAKARADTDWARLLPDPKKAGILYFEDGGYSQRRVGGFVMLDSRLTLIHWFNSKSEPGKLLSVQQRTILLLDTLFPANNSRAIETRGLSIKLSGLSSITTDPFRKYSAYENLFNFRNQPYGWLAFNLQLKVYVSPECLD